MGDSVSREEHVEIRHKIEKLEIKLEAETKLNSEMRRFQQEMQEERKKHEKQINKLLKEDGKKYEAQINLLNIGFTQREIRQLESKVNELISRVKQLHQEIQDDIFAYNLKLEEFENELKYVYKYHYDQVRKPKKH